jgi:hypothetical protein
VIAAWLVLAGAVSAASSAPSAEQLFERRADPVALEGALQAARDAAAVSPGDAAIRLLRARSELFWCDLHPGADPNETRAHLKNGVTAADEALRLLSPGFRGAIAGGSNLAQSLATIEPGGAPALFWLAANQHRFCASIGLRCLLAEGQELQSLFARVEQLSPGFFHGGPERHLAELELASPAGFGGPMKESAARLARSASQGPGLLETHLVWAEQWAVKAQDYRTFQSELKLVLDASLDAAPALRPENALAQQRARNLLQRSAELFTRPAREAGRAAEKVSSP